MLRHKQTKHVQYIAPSAQSSRIHASCFYSHPTPGRAARVASSNSTPFPVLRHETSTRLPPILFSSPEAAPTSPLRPCRRTDRPTKLHDASHHPVLIRLRKGYIHSPEATRLEPGGRFLLSLFRAIRAPYRGLLHDRRGLPASEQNHSAKGMGSDSADLSSRRSS